MTRFLVAALALSAATAATASARFVAVPSAAASEARVISRDTFWNCTAAGCTARESNARPAIVCAGLVREVGALASFAADGRAFGAEELQACNRRARAVAGRAATTNQAAAN